MTMATKTMTMRVMIHILHEDENDQQDIHVADEDDQQDSDQEGSETHDKDLQERDGDSPAGAGNVSYISWMGAY